MAGLDPAIHVFLADTTQDVDTQDVDAQDVDARHEPTAVRLMLIPSLA
jgi:hypothetical protein